MMLLGKKEHLRSHREELFSITTKYHITKFFTENLIAIEMKKTEILINKPVCLGLSILKLSKMLMHEFWWEYVKPKNWKKAKLCYMDTESFIVYIETNDLYKDIAEDF